MIYENHTHGEHFQEIEEEESISQIISHRKWKAHWLGKDMPNVQLTSLNL